jgi:carboxymethylenebutenolidase
MSTLARPALLVSLVVAALILTAHPPLVARPATAVANVAGMLPAPGQARSILNGTSRFTEWVYARSGSGWTNGFVVYPNRLDKAPVMMVSADREGASDWVRAVGDRAAAAGFIAAVPDVLAGEAPDGGDTYAFGGRTDAIRAALARLGPVEIARRENAVRVRALTLPSANGRAVALRMRPALSRIEVTVDGAVPRVANFALSDSGLSDALRHAAEALEDTSPRPLRHPNHAGHGPAALEAQTRGAGPAPAGRGGLAERDPDIVASVWTAPSTVARSTLPHHWADIPVGGVNMRTWVHYPQGNGPAPVVVVMQHATGMDIPMRAVAHQLAHHGFIAVAPDLFSGFAPNGGGRDAFRYPDEAMRAAAGRLTPDETVRRYKAAWEYGRKLPRANGKTGTIGFCGGGVWSFRFAGEAPEVNAAVLFYGGSPDEAIMAKINAPVLGLYGEDDGRITEGVKPTAEAMKRLGKQFEYRIYPGATHAFLLYQAEARNGEATADAWPRAMAFLRQHLN